MTQKELILLSLLLADTPEERHGVYARRKPTGPPAVVPLSDSLPVHHFVFPHVQETRPFLGGIE